MRLIIDSRAKATAMIPISWCLDESDKEKIREDHLLYPHMLIVISSRTLVEADKFYDENEVIPLDEELFEKEQAYYYREEKRYLRPLKDGTVYVTFDYPGEFQIFAAIVGDSRGDLKRLRKRNIGNEKLSEIDINGSLYLESHSIGPIKTNVVILKDFFAKEPSDWEKKFMSYWPFFSDKIRDDCAVYKRRMAYVFLLLAIPVFWIIRIFFGLVAFGIVFTQGRRNIGYKAVLNPYEDLADVFLMTKFRDCVFLSNGKGDPSIFTIALHPWLLGLLAILARASFGRWASWSEFLARFAIFAACGYVIITGILVMIILWDYFKNKQKQSEYVRFQESNDLLLNNQLNELSYLTCSSTTEPDSRPPLTTFTLKIQKFKSSHCKPMSQKN